MTERKLSLCEECGAPTRAPPKCGPVNGAMYWPLCRACSESGARVFIDDPHVPDDEVEAGESAELLAAAMYAHGARR